MTLEETAKAFIRSIDLSILISSLERAKSHADSCQEYSAAERIDEILVDLYWQKHDLKGIIVG